jgi:2-oxo-4-hydroxy-4-carboxy-5-ureidoimidazoline decarboxylase
MSLESFNALADDDARHVVGQCLDVPRWIDDVVDRRPYPDVETLLRHAGDSADHLTDAEFDAALARHPRIGERAGAGHDVQHSEREQAGVDPASNGLVERLLAGNHAYEEKFGRVFLIRAAGRSGEEILGELERRLGNEPSIERGETVRNLREIALLRLQQVV